VIAKPLHNQTPGGRTAGPTPGATPSTASGRFARSPWPPVIVFAILLTVYVVTLAPGLVGGDTPELATSAHVLGIPHQPGYPLYVLVGRLASLIPIAEVAWRVNLLSAIGGAAAGAALCAFLLGSGVGGLVAVLLSIAAGLSLTTWSQSIAAEVYTLGLALALWALVFFDRWRCGGNVRCLWAAAYVGGLAVGHQPLTLLLLSGVAISLVRALRRRRLGWGTVGIAVVWFVLPFTIFLVLPLRSALRPLVDYARISSAGDFFYHALGVASRSEFLSEGASGMRHALELMFRVVTSEIGILTLLLVGVAVDGAIRMLRHDRERLWLLWLPILLILLFALFYGIHDIENYLIIPFWLITASAGFMAARPPAPEDEPLAPRRRTVDRVAVGIAALFVVSAVWANHAVCNRSDYHLVDDFVDNTLECVPDDGALFLYTETLTGPFAYHTGILRKRADVRLIDMTGKVMPEPFGFRQLTGDWREERWRRMEALYLDRPPELAGRAFCALMFSARRTDEDRFAYRRRGLVYELSDPAARPMEAAVYWNEFTLRLPSQALLAAERTGFALTPLILRFYGATGTAAAAERLQSGDIDGAISTYQHVIHITPDDVAARERLAWALVRSGDMSRAEAELRAVVALKPDAVQALNALAVILLQKGGDREAEELLRRALTADATVPLTRLNLGRLLSRDVSRSAEAIEHLEAFVTLAPEDPDILSARELLMRLRGR